MNEDPVQTNCSKTLLVHHLPAELSEEEKEDLLKYFGAESVRVFSNRGRLVRFSSPIIPWAVSHILTFIWVARQSEHVCPFPQKHAAFATFRSEKSAARVSVLFETSSGFSLTLSCMVFFSPLNIFFFFIGSKQTPSVRGSWSDTHCGVCKRPRSHNSAKGPACVRKVSCLNNPGLHRPSFLCKLMDC